MKIQKTLLWFILPVLPLFGNCTTSYTYYHDGYNFENNDVLIDNYGETYACPFVILDDNTKIFFDLYTRSQITKGNRLRIGGVEPYLCIKSKYHFKSIKTVTLNKVTIQAGNNEFNIIEEVNKISIMITGKEKDTIYKRFSKEDMDTVHSSGNINAEAHKKRFDDLPEDTITRTVLIGFNIIPIDYTVYREILLKFNITVEYTTGETIRLDQEFLGIYETKKITIYRPLFTA